MANWVHKRAGGRRRVNADRQGRAWRRRLALAETFNLMALLHKTGAQARAAEYFAVSPATISRDVRAIFRWRVKDSTREDGRIIRLMGRKEPK